MSRLPGPESPSTTGHSIYSRLKACIGSKYIERFNTMMIGEFLDGFTDARNTAVALVREIRAYKPVSRPVADPSFASSPPLSLSPACSELQLLDLDGWRAQQREALLKDKQEAERREAEQEAERTRAATEKVRLNAEIEVWAAQEAQRLQAEEAERQRLVAEKEQRRQAEETERQRVIVADERRCRAEEAERSRKLATEKAEQERRRKAEEDARQRKLAEERAEEERRRQRLERLRSYNSDMTGQEFERYLAYQLSRRGLVPRVTGGAGDRGADIVLDTPLRRAVIQAKHHNKRVGNKAVQEVVTARGIYEKRTGKKFDAWVISPSGFSPQAESDARELGVILVDDPESFFDSLIPPSPNPLARTAAGPQTESTRGSASPA